MGAYSEIHLPSDGWCAMSFSDAQQLAVSLAWAHCSCCWGHSFMGRTSDPGGSEGTATCPISYLSITQVPVSVHWL